MDKYQIMAIMGKSGSGKDLLCKTLLQQPEFKDAKPIISCTTRPIRDNEKDGVDYHFLTNEEFTNQVLSGEMIEATIFNNWCYGTSYNNVSKTCLNIGVFNPEGVEILRTQSAKIDLKLIYLEANDKDRLLRQLNREKEPNCYEIVRRFGTDENDFAEEVIEFLRPDMFILNNEGADINKIAHSIAEAWTQKWF